VRRFSQPIPSGFSARAGPLTDGCLPITQASVLLEAILTKTQRLRFNGKLEIQSPTIPHPPRESTATS